MSLPSVAMEVRSEPGIMPFNASLQKSPPQTQSITQSMRLVYSQDGTAIYKPITTTSPSPTPPPPAAAAAAAPPTYHGEGVGGGGSGNIEVSSLVVPPSGLTINSGEPVKRKRGRPRKYGPDGTMALALTCVSPDSMNRPRSRLAGSSKKQQMAALGYLYSTLCISIDLIVLHFTRVRRCKMVWDDGICLNLSLLFYLLVWDLNHPIVKLRLFNTMRKQIGFLS